jgi:Leucine-rich repeat (LRR) protein
MHKLLLTLLILIYGVNYVYTARCPETLPEFCTCDNQEDGILVRCHQSPNLNETLSSLNPNDTIDRLDIANCNPRVNELRLLPPLNVKSLTINGCGLEKIADNAFKNVGKVLEDLRLPNNSLKKIPSLKQLPNLVTIGLSHNQISDVPDLAFDGATSLRQIRLSNNKICSLATYSFVELKQSLEVLDLSGNCFSTVPSANIRNLQKLSHLDFSENKIAELAQFTFMNLPLLKELRLNSNRLGALPPLAFMNIPTLTHLYVKDNKIKKLEPGTLQVFKELEVVDFTRNEIASIPSFKEMEKLKFVHLDHNKIQRIETMTFSSNPALQMISLQDNEISLIARNSFDALDQLIILLLTNNSLSSIEKSVFDGMRNLQQLNLHNNSLVEITNATLASLPKLNVADFSMNEISRIQPGSFSKQTNLFWLDLSNNNITTLEKGTFDRRIANIMLDGNKLYCDEKFDWFVTYLVQNQVRTFLPNQPEIKCDGPEKFAGVRLKDLMIKKANDTLVQSLGNPGMAPNANIANSGGNVIASILPGLISGAGNGAGAAGPGFLGSFTQAIPALRNFPGLNMVPEGHGGATGNPRLDSAINRFSEPLVRWSGGGKPGPADIRQMIDTLPELIVNIPGFGNVDLAKVPPQVLDHVLRGGQIPGIPRETLDTVVKQYTERMYQAALRAQNKKPLPGDEKYLPPLTTLPQEVVTTFMSPKGIPYLDKEQIRTIQEYYTSQIPLEFANNANDGNNSINPQMFSMLNLLPPNYNMSKIPPEVIKQVLRGEMPDFALLPQDIIEYLRSNSDRIFNSVKVPPNTTIEEILGKLPRFDPPVFNVTFAPYDINKVDGDLVLKEEGFLSSSQTRWLTAIALGLLGTVSIVILGVYVYYLRKNRLGAT